MIRTVLHLCDIIRSYELLVEKLLIEGISKSEVSSYQELEQLEIDMLRRALTQSKNVKQAADSVGVTRKIFDYHIKKHGIK